MASVRISTSVASTEFPAGTTFGQYRFRLSKGTLPVYTQYIDAPLPDEVIFQNVAAGDYTLSIQRQSAAGLLIGTAYTYTAPISVAAPAPAVGDVPVSAVVSVI